VYLGHDKKDNRLLAIKVIEMSLIEEDNYLFKSLKNEVQCMKNLKGNNIVKLYDVFFTKNNVYIM